MQQAASQIRRVHLFFSNLSGFSAFFTHSPKRTTLLDDVVHCRLPRTVSTCWNFQSQAVSVVQEPANQVLSTNPEQQWVQCYYWVAGWWITAAVRGLGVKLALGSVSLIHASCGCTVKSASEMTHWCSVHPRCTKNLRWQHAEGAWAVCSCTVQRAHSLHPSGLLTAQTARPRRLPPNSHWGVWHRYGPC